MNCLVDYDIHPTTKYAMEIVSGERVACKAEILACQRHLNDLNRQGTDEFPYVFSEQAANKIFKRFDYIPHIKGPLAGQMIELEPFQKFDLGCLFGWVHKDTGLRRFDKAYKQEGRKNGKSTKEAGIALYLMAGEREESPEVYFAAVDKDQARIVYKIASAMARKSPHIRNVLKIRGYEISHKVRGGELVPLSRETENKDGLNPSGVIIDEYHAHRTSEIHDLLWSAWGARAQALMVIITTAGVDAEKSPCYLEYQLCKQILDPENPMKNERYFIMIRELDKGDDEHDPKNWIKANPLRAATPDGLEKLQKQHDIAFDSKIAQKIRTFKIKNLDIWVFESENNYIGEFITNWDDLAVIPKKDVKKQTSAKDFMDRFAQLTQGWTCICGVDLSKSIDLTACGFVFVAPGGKIAVCAHGFIPEGAVAKHENTDDVPYRDWIKDGWVTQTDGDVTDYDEVTAYIHKMEEKNQWKLLELAYDPYQATKWAGEWIDQGYTCVEIRQGVQTLSEPTKDFRDLIAKNELIHDGSPALKWCLINAKEVTDRNGNIVLSKKNPDDTQRIDLLAAIINAMARLQALKDAGGQDMSEKILSDKWGM